MFLIPLLVIFLLSVCGGILFSVLLMNMGIIEIPPKYGWLNVVVLSRKSPKYIATEKTTTSREVANYITLAMVGEEAGGVRTTLFGTSPDYIYATALESIVAAPNVSIVGTVACSPQYVNFEKSDIIVVGELGKKSLTKVKPISRELSAEDSIPGGRPYGYQS